MVRKLIFLLVLLLLAILSLAQEIPAAPQRTPSSEQAAAAQEKSSTTAKPGSKKEGDEEVPVSRKPKRNEVGSPAQAEATSTVKTSEKKPADPLTSVDTYRGLHLRSIGPAFISGRVTSVAVNPFNRAQYYVGVASGGVWKTDNDGHTWNAVFQNEGSFSVGDVKLDPHDPAIVWVGTGENNSQRSVSYGDGIYKSEDGGKSWTNLGLKHSEHIGRIAISPKDSKTVFVAAEGPLWSPGGDRITYVADVNGVLQVFTKTLGSTTRTQITHEKESCLDPMWSADATRIYFIEGRRPSMSLRSVAVAGGDSEMLLDRVYQADLSPGGKEMAVIVSDSDGSDRFRLAFSSPPGAPPKRYSRPPFADFAGSPA